MSQETTELSEKPQAEGILSSPKGPIPVDSQKLHRSVNKWAARFTPFMLVGAVGYATWVVVALLAVNTYIHPQPGRPYRTGTGIAILVIYCLVFLAMVICYSRLLWTMFFNNAFVPLEPQNSSVGPYLDRASILNGTEATPTGIDAFASRDLFECDIDGLPRWCNTCKIWKPDRSHHCSQVGRCVYKMDHFCPWAGGVICETSFKFFIQFCCYAALYCIFVVIVTSYSLTQLDKTSYYGRNTAATIGLGSIFGLFSGSLGLQSLQFAGKNTTTVDNLGHAFKVYSFAVLKKPGPIKGDTLTPCHPQQAPTDTGAEISFPLQRKGVPDEHFRTFRIWQTPVGYNPYDLGSSWENMKTTMGVSIWDWLLPIHYSPSSTFLTRAREPEVGYSAMYRVRTAVEAIKQSG